jgi:hypothetical protein
MQGWMSWNHFRCETAASACAATPTRCVSAALLAETAAALRARGLADAGYDIVAVDDCWAARQRGPGGSLVADAARFPAGLAGAAAGVRAHGLRFGVYTDVGPATCGGYPGSGGHFGADARLFAAVGASYVKADGCNVGSDDLAAAYGAFGAALNATGRPMVFACSWPAYAAAPVPFPALIATCNTWRNWNDVDTTVDSVAAIARWFARSAASTLGFAAAPRPGAWHDPDELLVGEPSIPHRVQALQLAVWAVSAAPLFLSADARSMSDAAVALATHPAILAINQDPAGMAPLLLAGGERAARAVAWARPLAGGRAAAVAANLGGERATVTLHLPRHALGPPAGEDARKKARLCWVEVDLSRAGAPARAAAPLAAAAALPHSPQFAIARALTRRGWSATVDVPGESARLFLVSPCLVRGDAAAANLPPRE